ncbi:hypothetical protein RF11_07119 [Thelohanellus kitauei]|uniref:ISXO2-like transposase domain-containing protein n=1 Tax=Thelohanellus kitauei TaxID=669202 RepID=A0A0C2IXD4_THEKT|nr:hypothetical protein RF11_07119 [Thelohanellus kitauei]
MKDILSRHILPGTIVYRDMWKAYNQPCNDLSLEHKTVNYSLTSKDPVTGVHTNIVEGLNNGLKCHIRARNRKKHKKNYCILFGRENIKIQSRESFIEAVKNTKYFEF